MASAVSVIMLDRIILLVSVVIERRAQLGKALSLNGHSNSTRSLVFVDSHAAGAIK
jgi:hypothetical protein